MLAISFYEVTVSFTDHHFSEPCSIDPKYVQVHLSKQGRRHEEVSVSISDGAVNSHPRKILTQKQFLAFHGITFHFSSMSRIHVYE